MDTASIEQKAPLATTQRRASPWGYYTYCEALKLLRNPPVAIFGIGFPTFFFLLFGTTFGASAAPIILASYSAYAAFVVPFSSLSNTVAAERGMGWQKLLRTTPLSVALYLSAKVITTILIGIIALLLLFVVAATIGKVSLGVGIWLQLLGIMVVGMIPFIVTGLFVGLVASATAAQAVSTILFLLLSFTSGLFVPIFMLPTFIQKIAPYLPTYHLGQLAWITVGKGSSDGKPLWFHLLALAGYTVVILALVIWAYRRDESRNFS